MLFPGSRTTSTSINPNAPSFNCSNVAAKRRIADVDRPPCTIFYAKTSTYGVFISLKECRSDVVRTTSNQVEWPTSVCKLIETVVRTGRKICEFTFIVYGKGEKITKGNIHVKNKLTLLFAGFNHPPTLFRNLLP